MYKQLRDRRRELKLTQNELARLARVSLATLQNIEAGRGNPSYATLATLLSALGCELEIRRTSINWGALWAVGVPLFGQDLAPAVVPHRDYLKRQLMALFPQLSTLKVKTREHLAVISFLCALRDHYPQLWQECPAQLDIWLRKQKTWPSPKLRRLALQKLSEYL